MKKEKGVFQQIQSWFLQLEEKKSNPLTKTERMAALGSILFVVLLILKNLVSISNTISCVMLLLVILLELPELIKIICFVREGIRRQ
ncbi:hypothetical protein [Ruminococcus sp.]|uniref:hypothetical protein n=1 Tax=Ruminococcus sp. TaxID=41978 RepID=UPI0025E9136D|nr:hypothetical protein [Ruminococcus sp.]